MNLRQGTLLQGGKYRIERELGHGGFGVTYSAVQVGLNRRVAIKEFFMSEYCNRDAETSHVTVPSEGSKELVEKFRGKFIKEAQNIASLKHPHIISIHDVFEENGTAYYVMEYLDHGSLADLVKQRGHLPEADALRYTRQIADALRYIHARKMNHLDVKPGNILIDEEDHAVLIDFGLSKRYDDEGNQTSTTPVGISHGYAPLEQYKKGGVGTFSPTTDIYSLGATLYKLITGATPPDANEVSEEGLPPFPAYVSSSTGKAIEQAMQFRRKDRPQSMEEFLALLDAIASAASTGASAAVKEEEEVDEQTKLIVEDEDNGSDSDTSGKDSNEIHPTGKASMLHRLKNIHRHFWDFRGRTTRKAFLMFMSFLAPFCFLVFICTFENPLLEFRWWMQDMGIERYIIYTIWNTVPLLFILSLTLCLEFRRLNDCGRARWWAYIFNLPLLLIGIEELVEEIFEIFSFLEPLFIPLCIIPLVISLLTSLYIAIRFFLAKSKS